jgi:hypothetical protein
MQKEINKKKIKCDAHVGRRSCKGTVKRVVISGGSLTFPIEFNYCNAAIVSDRGKGFIVKIEDNE